MVLDWYANPAWYALALSVGSIIVSIVTIYTTRRTARGAVEQSLVRQRNDINEAIMRYAIKGPFATILQVPDTELAKSIPRVGVLFLQINMLEDVYQHRDILGLERLASYRVWATTILKPWIESDEHLQNVLKLIYSTNDLMDKNFVGWLQMLIPLSDSLKIPAHRGTGTKYSA